MGIIEREFQNKEYKFEHWIFPYSIDFAWINKKLAIEIDGKQHELIENKEHDKKKDDFLTKNGWTVLRIKWRDMFNDSQFWIRKASQFIHGEDADMERPLTLNQD